MLETYASTILTPKGQPIAGSPDSRFIARNNGPLIDRSSAASTDFPSHQNVMTEFVLRRTAPGLPVADRTTWPNSGGCPVVNSSAP